MKPTQQHIWVERPDAKSGRKCGDETPYSYIDDEDYRVLPECKDCFEWFRGALSEGVNIDYPTAKVSVPHGINRTNITELLPVKKILLRDYL
jgi:hypothetical protein